MPPRAHSRPGGGPRAVAALLAVGLGTLLSPPAGAATIAPAHAATRSTSTDSVAAPLLGPVPFGNGERLLYELSWLGIVGGTAELRIDAPTELDGTLVYRITSVARSNPFFSRIFPVEDRVESLVEARRFRSLQFAKQLREGTKQRSQLVRFDPVRNVAEEDGQELATPAQILDALSALYYVRTLDLATGRPLQVAVHADGRNYDLHIEVLAHERIRTPFGERLAWKLEPHQQYEGVFAQRGRLWVWISDDASRLPLLMRSSLVIGSISARLVDYRLSTSATPSASDLPPAPQGN